MLKQLGYFNQACRSYEAVLIRRPSYVRARYALAAVLVILKRFDEATEILGDAARPHTADDWYGFQVRATMLLKLGQTQNAILLLESGLQENPFHRSRETLRLALAAAYLAQSRTEEAMICLEENEAPAAQVLWLHAYGLAGNVEKAQYSLSIANDNEVGSIALKSELAAKFGLSRSSSKYPKSWLLEQEANLILQVA